MTEPKKRLSYTWVWWIVGLLLFYVLSIGPVARLRHELDARGYPVEWIDSAGIFIYAPLAYCAKNNEAVMGIFLRYYELWGIDI